MPNLNESLPDIRKARLEAQKAEEALYLRKIELEQKLRPEDYGQVREQIQAAEKEVQRMQDRLRKLIGQLYETNPLRRLVSQMDAGFPILLLPLRLETRFVPTDRAVPQLLIRIYPDDIHIHNHEPILTEKEIKAGEFYWRSLAAANQTGVADPDADRRAAWQQLVDFSDPQRALWIAKQTQPKNWKPDFADDAGQLDFPEHEISKSYPWTRAPRTQLLPDQFVVSIYRGEQIVHEQLGKVLPDTIFMGPDPFKGETAIEKIDEEIKFDEDFAWMTDFEKAVEIGLALRIDLKPEHFNHNRIDRIVVTGLLASADPEQSRELVEQLIDNQHYSRKGFSLVPQGTPTNNTDRDTSGYSRNEDLLAKGYYDGAPATTFTDIPDAEGKLLADALGIHAGVLESVNNAGLREWAPARDMNSALYPATIGNFFEVLMKPVLKTPALKRLRDFFTDYVTARGPLAAVRIGNQPYSVLLTSNLAAWQEPNDGFYNQAAEILRRLQNYWDTMARQKAGYVSKGGDPGELMLNILGLQPGSVTFGQRLGNLPDFSYAVPTFKDGLEGAIVNKQQQIVDWLKTLGFNPEAQNNYYPFASNLVFYDFINKIGLKQLVDGKENTLDRFLDDLTDGLNYIEWLAQVKTVKELENQKFGRKTPNAILYLLLRHALLLELQRKAEEFYVDKNVQFQRAAFSKSLFNFNTAAPDLTSWELLSGQPSTVNAQFAVQKPIGDYFLSLDFAQPASAGLREVRSALGRLAKLSTLELERLLADHIDLCTYRLDAWQMGLFQRRLEQKRQKQPQGLYVGAFGWVQELYYQKITPVTPDRLPELLKPENDRPVYKQAGNQGFVHTPSLNHATSTGLLLAGYHHHATKSDPSPFAINMSSERVRRAMFVYEGVRNGQMMEALLGYQFERALHDITSTNLSHNLNQYILTIREKFPIEATAIPQQGEANAQETVPAFSVVNGLKLIEKGAAALPSLVGNATHRGLIQKEIDRLADTLDALNDLLVAESAYHATQGNYDRTAGVLNSLRYAEMPPELTVVDTPRSSQLGYTQRVSLHFDAKSSFKPGGHWTAVPSHRALMEPGLNVWLGGMMGNPQQIICEVVSVDGGGVESAKEVITLANLALQPIDLLYIIGADLQAGATELEARIADAYRRRASVAAETSIKIHFHPPVSTANQRTFAQFFPLARTLRLLVTNARPAGARDYQPQSKTVAEAGADPFQWDFDELHGRVTEVLNKLNDDVTNLGNRAPNDILPKDNTNPATFAELVELYETDAAAREGFNTLELSPAAVSHMLSFLQVASLYGVAQAYPDNLNVLTTQTPADFLAKVIGIWKTMAGKAIQADAKIAAAVAETNPRLRIDRLVEAGKAALGEEYVIIPRFRYANPDDVKKSLQDKGKQLLHHIRVLQQTDTELAMETWLQSVARVRPNLARLEQLRMVAPVMGGAEPELQVAQLPHRENDSWLGVEFPATRPDTGEPFRITDDTIALTIIGDDAAKTAQLQSALILDDWTETIPVAEEITGIAYHYNQPSAAAPNALLLAVEPTGSSHWSWEALQGTLTDTLRRAKSRAVEPAHLLEDPVLSVLLPMTVADYDLRNANVSLDYMVADNEFLAFVKGKGLELYSAWED